MTRRTAIVLVIVIVTVVGLGAYYVRQDEKAKPAIVADVVSRGDIVQQVAASGTLEAVTTVQVGTQVSGTVQTLYADFNSLVKKGQLLAKLDPSLFQTQVQQENANLTRAAAELERVKVALMDADTKLKRAQELAARQLIPATDLETAQVTRQSAEAQVRSAEAAVTQARASLRQAQVNLDKTIITSPIDGIVTARNVDVGQTVAASLQAPTLFVLAADLREMQVKANVDESDLGQVHEGQEVSFRVDAYPNKAFKGVVEQVRLNPTVEQNVVTYAAIVKADNPALELMPGMTANVTIESARRSNVLRVPVAALRFKPTDELLAAFGQTDMDIPSASGPKSQAVGTSGRGNSASAGDGGRQPAGQLWLYDDAGLHPVMVRTGISDGQYTEVQEGPISEGTRVAVRVAQPGTASSMPTSSNPLIPAPRRRF
jgi:HlyD family secretion protein